MSEHRDQPTRTLQNYLHPTRIATPSYNHSPLFMARKIKIHIREFEEVVATFHSQNATSFLFKGRANS
jgi:hypothetical protein